MNFLHGFGVALIKYSSFVVNFFVLVQTDASLRANLIHHLED